MKRIIQEDDCASDAREYFEKSLKRITGVSIKEFKTKAKRIEVDELTTEWHLDNFCLSFAGDFPYYEVYEGVQTP